jgi:hypothetical protein
MNSMVAIVYVAERDPGICEVLHDLLTPRGPPARVACKSRRCGVCDVT